MNKGENLAWSQQPGFNDLSDSAKKLAIYAENNDGAIAGALKQDASLIDGVDEFSGWSNNAIRLIANNTATNESSHSIKKNLKK